MIDPTPSLNAPMALMLDGHQVDAIAEWARLDGQYMAASDLAEISRLRILREALAMDMTMDLVLSMIDFDPASDLAAAIRERQEGYAAYRAAHP